jgi:hypothetical protein
MRESRIRKRNAVCIRPKKQSLSAVFLETEGVVYVVASDGYWKIGVTYGNVQDRIRSMQTGNPHEISLVWSIRHLQPEQAEARLHAAFDHKRVRGEWFTLDMSDRGRLLTAMAVEVGANRQLHIKNDIDHINAEAYDVPVVAGDYDVDDVRAYMGVTVPGDPGYEGVFHAEAV